jgi:hypothetical protein
MNTRPLLSGPLSVRLAAGAGAMFFALFLGFAQLTSGSPSATDSGTEIFDFVARHDDRLQLAAALMGIAMSAVLVWLSGLFRALTKAEGGFPGIASVALGGGVLAAAGTVTGALVLGATANRVADIGAAGAAVGWTMFLLSIGATLLGLLLVTGVTALISLQGHLFARWFGWASMLLALLSLAGAVTIGFSAPGIQVVAGIAVVLDCVWILLVSLFLWRDPALALPVETEPENRSESLGSFSVAIGQHELSGTATSARHRG